MFRCNPVSPKEKPETYMTWRDKSKSLGNVVVLLYIVLNNDDKSVQTLGTLSVIS